MTLFTEHGWMQNRRARPQTLAADLQRILLADEREVSTQLQEEAFQVHDDRLLTLLLGMPLRQIQKVHGVTVFEDSFCIWIQLCHRWRHFWPTQNGTIEKCTV